MKYEGDKITQQYESDVLYHLDDDYPLVAGDWRIFRFNPETKEKIEERYSLIKTTSVKDIQGDGMKIIAAARVR